MKKPILLLIGVIVVINICLGSIAGFTLISTSDAYAESSRKTLDEQTSPKIYDPSNTYYLVNPTVRSTVQYSKGVPFRSDGADPDLYHLPMVNGRIYSFPWPPITQKPAKLRLNETFTGQPFISLVVNSKEDASKTFVVTLGIDTNNKYDPHIPTSLEHRCEFQPYQTSGDMVDGTMEEEVYEAFGTWQGGLPPSVIERGRVILEVTMTSPNGMEAILYCGFNYKNSWFACPYMHTDLVPRARINDTYRMQGFSEENKIYVGDRVVFDGGDSFDPNDDLNGNEKIDSFETDRLRYKWSWGDGTSTSLDFGNRRASHIYTADKIPLTAEFKDFQVNLTVMDLEGHSDFNTTWVRVYRGNHSPEILSLKINDVDQLAPFPKEIVSVLDERINVFFSTQAIDDDGDDITYYWDFDDDGKYEIVDKGGPAGSFLTYSFSPVIFKEGKHRINLEVSDHTLATNATASCQITLKTNIFPVAIVQAKREFDPMFYEKGVTVKINQLITFYSNKSYDPDNLIGFDIDNDNKTDYQLKYRWNFNIMDPSATSGWITSKSYEYTYLSAGTYKYFVTLDVDDGVNVTTSEVFVVNINVRPIAKIIINPQSYDSKGNLMKNQPIYFNGSNSYDPNGDNIMNYTWTIGSGDKALTKYGKIMIHKFKESGRHIVSLKVFDGEFWSTDYQINVDIPEPPKPPIVSFEANPTDVFTLKKVNFDASNTTDPDSDLKHLKYIWDFGDGEPKYITRENTTFHIYRVAGKYKVTLTVEDETGTNASKSDIEIDVKNTPPVAKITEIKNAAEGKSIQVSGAKSDDRDGEIVLYIWDFGDNKGNTTTEEQVTHKWNKAGTYTIELTVQDNHGGTDTTQYQIKVKSTGEDDDNWLGLSEEQSNTLLAGIIITIIVVAVIIIVVFVIIRSREAI
jgi:PKD repeat protein